MSKLANPKSLKHEKMNLEIFCLKATLIERLNAFYLFKEEGLKEAQRIYPDQTHFLARSMNKSYKKVRNEICNELMLLKSRSTFSLN